VVNLNRNDRPPGNPEGKQLFSQKKKKSNVYVISKKKGRMGCDVGAWGEKKKGITDCPHYSFRWRSLPLTSKRPDTSPPEEEGKEEKILSFSAKQKKGPTLYSWGERERQTTALTHFSFSGRRRGRACDASTYIVKKGVGKGVRKLRSFLFCSHKGRERGRMNSTVHSFNAWCMRRLPAFTSLSKKKRGGEKKSMQAHAAGFRHASPPSCKEEGRGEEERKGRL